jgi:hypothetical protein
LGLVPWMFLSERAGQSYAPMWYLVLFRVVMLHEAKIPACKQKLMEEVEIVICFPRMSGYCSLVGSVLCRDDWASEAISCPRAIAPVHGLDVAPEFQTIEIVCWRAAIDKNTTIPR